VGEWYFYNPNLIKSGAITSRIFNIIWVDKNNGIENAQANNKKSIRYECTSKKIRK